MSVYKLLPSHYIKLHGPNQKENIRSFTDEQFENLKLLLKCSNAKLTSLAQTVRDLRRQLKERDATIARLSGHKPTHISKYSLEVLRLQPESEDQAQNVVVDVSSDMQVQLRVEYVDENSEPAIQVASSIVTKPRHPGPLEVKEVPHEQQHETSDASKRNTCPPTEQCGPVRSSAPGPVRKVFADSVPDRGSPFYSSLMWRTRQRAKEKGYRFVWSRCGKILVKKDVQSPSVYILDEADLRKMV